MKSFITLILSVLIISTLTACSTSSRNVQDSEPEIRQSALQVSPENLLQQAKATNDITLKTKLQLKAANQYYLNRLIAQSSAILKNINYATSTPATSIELLEANLKLGIHEDLPWHVDKAIELFEQSNLNRANIDTLKTIIPLLASAFEKQSNRIKSATLLIEYAGVLAPLSNAELNEKVWAHLRAIDSIELYNFKYDNNDTNVIAWIELARTILQHEINLESQYTALREWQRKWPNHPASLDPPREIALLSKLPESKASTIILALPFTGPVSPVGKAVRDGFTASYYNALSSSQSEPVKLAFFDTNINTIEELYKVALKEQALIVGPLTKKNVNKLSNIDLSLSPTLALNYLDDTYQPAHPKDNLFQFGLNPDTEIRQLSKYLSSQRLSKIAYIGPENEQGSRIHDSLLKALKEQQSQIIESVYYDNQKTLSPSVAKLLGTDLSLQRKRTIQRITNLNFEFEPRRRKDIDAIFMLAKPTVAKQLNPLFAYHYAKDLPIYSSSQIHQTDDQKNDLDNIHFIEMPWMLSNSIEIKSTIINAIPNARTDYSRFYALGADAFNLSPRLQLLKEIQNSQIQGYTGTLSINQSGIVERDLELVVFKRGKATLLKNRAKED